MDKKKNIVDIVILGHIAKDIIVIDDVSHPAIGGAVYYGAIAGSNIGLKVVVITRLTKEDFSILEDFNKYGIKYFAYASDESSGIRNIYKSENMEFRTCEPLGFAGLFKKEEIPEIETRFFVLAPILAGEIDITLLTYLKERYPGKLCLDIQGFVRVRDKLKKKVFFCKLSQNEKEEILSKINILKLDHAEAEALTEKSDINSAAKELLKLGPKEILITHKRGVSLFTIKASYFYPWKNKQLKGRTGRGDTVFISYVGSRLSMNPKDSLKFATALTSLKLEQPGPFVQSIYQVEDLIKKKY
ncbi:MAG: PfkB family carbohydrate kinase [Promethearchaeota archaeon]